jgi:hypothetical protein
MSVRISTLLRFIVLFLSVAIFLSFSFLKEEHPYIDATGILLIELICLVIFFALGNFSTKYPPVIIVIINLILYVVLRVLVLIFYQDSFLGASKVIPEYFNVMLTYIIFGTIACFLGIAVGYSIKLRANPNFKNNSNDFTKLLSAAFLFSVFFKLIIYYAYGYSGATGSGEHLNFFNRYIARFVDPVALLIMFLVSYGLHKDNGRNHKLFIVVIGSYFLYYSLIGSRGAIYEILMLLLYLSIFMHGNFFIKIKLHTLCLFMLLPMIIPFFFLIDEIRKIQYSASNISFFDTVNTVLQFNFFDFNFEEILKVLSYRLSFLESTFYPMYALDVGYNDISDLVNFKTAFLSSLNRMMIGKPFGEILFFEYAFPFIFNNTPVYIISESGRMDYVGYLWTMFGMSYQLFGYIGGIFFISFFTAAISFFINLFKRLKSFGSYCLGLLLLYTLDYWVRNFGIDNLADRCFHMGIILLFYITILKLYKHVREVFQSYKAKAIYGAENNAGNTIF